LEGEVTLRIPSWLKTGLPEAEALGRVTGVIRSLRVNTICFEARCPNKSECFQTGSVTFLILGRQCTRSCRFCNVLGGQPQAVDCQEPRRIRQAAVALGLDYVVVTSVTRDDLQDGGAGHFCRCIEELRSIPRAPLVEVLVPDFSGNMESVKGVASAGPQVFGHNLETVERLYPLVRDGASYRGSIQILRLVSNGFPDVTVKSSLMLGLGETIEEVKSSLRDLTGAGCDIVTIGQYMQPSRAHLPVREYVDPLVFKELQLYARQLGLVAICGPRVRSSYQARATFHEANRRRRRCA
jgi:lipoic acid synthetase